MNQNKETAKGVIGVFWPALALVAASYALYWLLGKIIWI